MLVQGNVLGQPKHHFPGSVTFKGRPRGIWRKPTAYREHPYLPQAAKDTILMASGSCHSH